MVKLFVAASSMLLVFTAATVSFGDELTDKSGEEARAFLRIAMLKLDVQAAGCKEYMPTDAAQIRRKLGQYSRDVNGFDYFVLEPSKVDKIRAALARLPVAEGQSLCLDVLRKSVQEYMAIRDVFMRLSRNDGTVPPRIDLE